MQLLWACDRALESRFTSRQPFCSFDSVIYFCSQGFWVRNHSMMLQTVLCIPLMDGVLELGTTDRVSPWLINLQQLNPTIITGKLIYISCLMLLSFWVNIQNFAKWDHWHTHFTLTLLPTYIFQSGIKPCSDVLLLWVTGLGQILKPTKMPSSYSCPGASLAIILIIGQMKLEPRPPPEYMGWTWTQSASPINKWAGLKWKTTQLKPTLT